MSIATTESLIALELYHEELDGKLAETLSNLSDCKKGLADSEKNLSAAIREAIAQNGNEWPQDKTESICKLQQDIDRRTSTQNRLDKLKKKHTTEIERVEEITRRKIRDCLEGAGLFDPKAGPGDAWRTIELAHITDEDLSKEFAGQGLVSVGEFFDAVEGGRMAELLDKGIKKGSFNRMGIRVAHYIKARGMKIEGNLAGFDETAEPEPETTEAAGETKAAEPETTGPWPETVAVLGPMTTLGVIGALHDFMATQGDDAVKARQVLMLDEPERDECAVKVAALQEREPQHEVAVKLLHFRDNCPDSWAAIWPNKEGRARLDRALGAKELAASSS